MKIMFVSDIHGNIDSLQRIEAIYKDEKVDKIIFLGDMYYERFETKDEIDEIIDKFQNKYIIRGNCDTEIDILTSKLSFLPFYYFEAFGKKVFASHGNIYNIDRFPDKEFDILIGGHTHIGKIIKKNNKYFLNPGSISYPRDSSEKSYMIIDEKGIYLKDLDKNIIDKTEW
ncbi:MAG: phosphodiesterase [Bacilli bacterium]|nr:phosphodiesterase [Bacilli bacterium]